MKSLGLGRRAENASSSHSRPGAPRKQEPASLVALTPRRSRSPAHESDRDNRCSFRHAVTLFLAGHRSSLLIPCLSSTSTGGDAAPTTTRQSPPLESSTHRTKTGMTNAAPGSHPRESGSSPRKACTQSSEGRRSENDVKKAVRAEELDHAHRATGSHTTTIGLRRRARVRLKKLVNSLFRTLCVGVESGLGSSLARARGAGSHNPSSLSLFPFRAPGPRVRIRSDSQGILSSRVFPA